VTRDANGAVTVHNNPVMEHQQLPPQGKTATAMRRAAKAATPTKAAQPPPPPAKRTARARTAKKSTPPKADGEPSPSPRPAPPAFFRPEQPPLPPIHPVRLPGTGTAEGPRLAGNAVQLLQLCAHGIPPECDIQFHGDVLALAGVDLPAAEAAVRQPEAVNIATVETESAKHAVLRFMLGDVMVVVGFRQHPPMIIAAYFNARLIHDTHRTPERLGGGGSKAKQGVPTTPGALVMRLQGLGAEVDRHEDDLATVRYDGHDLGKIMLGNRASKDSCSQNWQRMQRRIHALSRRN